MNATAAKDSGSGSPSVDRSPGKSGEAVGSSPRAATEAASKCSCKPKVLVVEDDSHARKAVARILRLKGYAALEAGTVAEALVALMQRPDWVLLDLMLPD